MRKHLLCAVCLSAIGSARAATLPCIPPEEASSHIEKNICVAAHVYDVVDVSGGLRFVDVCKPGLPDEQCRFAIVSFDADRKEVGDLAVLKDQDIQIRGTIREFNGHAEIILSHERQLHGGSEKFRPNPQLIHGFSADRAHAPINPREGASGQHARSLAHWNHVRGPIASH